MSTVRIRQAGIADIPLIDALNRKTLPENYPYETWVYLLAQRHASFVAYENDELVGYVIAITQFDADTWHRTGHIVSLTVKPEARRRGIATRLMRTSLEHVRDKLLLKSCTLNVNVNNDDAKRLYETLGFLVTKTRPQYYSDGSDAYDMKVLLPRLSKKSWR